MSTQPTSAPPEILYRRDYRPPEYTITDIDITFDLDASDTRVTAISQVTRLNSNATQLRLDGENLTLVSLKINDVPWTDYDLKDDTLILNNVPEAFTLSIVNRIHPDKNTALQGLYLSGKALCTQCEAKGFRHITWYLDRPDVLACFTTTIIADSTLYPILLSNGNRISYKKNSNNRHQITWKDPFPKPCYLFALVAGDFDVLRDSFRTASGREVALEIYVDKGKLDQADWAMTSLKNSMKWDETRFGLEYDLDIFMLVAVEFFNMGAMENKGLNIFNSKYVLAKSDTATDKDYCDIEAVIGHEYFHNWTGNRVTCRDWFQLSLKEGLTVFRDQEFSSDLRSRAVNRINNVRTMRSAQFAEDASPMAHPIRPDHVIEMNNFYTLTVYEKGSEVIRMMHTLLGEENFQKGMRLYFSRHDGQAVTCEDFVKAMEDASSIDLSLFRRWYEQAGTPILTVRDEYFPERKEYKLHVSQMTPPTEGQKVKRPLHIPFNIELYDETGNVIALTHQGQPISSILNITETEQTFIFDNIQSRPIPSLLREFSAPVKLNYPWRDEQLTFLMRHACDDFSRWDAAQSLLANYIRLNVENYQQGLSFSLPPHMINAFRTVLLDKKIDPALAASILTVPGENEIAEWFEVIDPEANAKVRRTLIQTLANALKNEWLEVYKANQTGDYAVTQVDMSRRALKNTCLYYLAFSQDDQEKTNMADSLVRKHFDNADNMTDIFAALSAAVAAQLPCQSALLHNYDKHWRQDGLVMDKWFSLQATSPDHDVLTRVRTLLEHPSFSMHNPNRVRALVGAFVSGNPLAFHAINGSGYLFLREILTELNTSNPQIASRLIDPLIRLKRYDNVRQTLMRQTLKDLQKLTDLSPDLYEKIAKALAS